MHRVLSASIALLAFSTIVSAQVFPPDFGKPKLNVNPILLPDGSNVAPASVTVTASGTSGSANTFTMIIRDDNGWNDVKDFYLIVNSTLTTANACFIHLDPVRRTVRLANDKADAWTSLPTTFGGSAATETLSNTSCSLAVRGINAGISNYYSQSQSEFYITLPITFATTFAGTKNFYTFAEDFGGLSKPWGSNYSYSVPGPLSPVANTGYAYASTNGTTSSSAVALSLSTSASDANGSNDMTKMFWLINDRLSTANGCLVEIDLQAKTVRLANDSATDWLATQNVLTESGNVDRSSVNLSNSSCDLGPNSFGTYRNYDTSLSFVGSIALRNFASGKRQIHVFVEDKAGNNSGWKQVAIVDSPTPPTGGTAGTPDPNAGKNPPTIGNSYYSSSSSKQISTEQFQFSVQDKDLVGDISVVYALVNTSATGANGCLVEYDPNNGKLRLAQDNGTTWSAASLTPGAAGKLENSQCELDGASSSVSSYGNSETIQLSLQIRAKTAFAGMKNFYAYVVDKTDRTSGWVALTTWNVPGAVAPTTLISNSYVEGPRVQFSVSASDRNGVSDLRRVRLVFGTNATTVANSCVLEISISAQSRLLVLANDAGSTAGMPSLGEYSNGELANSQCTVSGFAVYGGYSAADGLSFSITVRALPSYSGNRQLFVSAVDQGGLDSGWLAGSIVAVSAQVAPTLSQLSIGNANSPFTAMQLRVRDENGLDSRLVVDLLIGSSASPAGQCWASYSREGGLWRLNDEAGAALQNVSFRLGGGSSALANSRCRLLAEGSTELYAGSALEGNMSFSFQFLPAFAGTKTVYGRVSDSTGLSSGWITLGSYTNPGAIAPTVVLTPPTGTASGANLAFMSQFGDTNGVENLKNGYVLINSTLSGANGCFVWLDFAKGQARLANDAGTGWSTSVSMQSGGTNAMLENSNCRVSVANSSGYATALVNSWSISFKETFGGQKRVYYYADNVLGKSVGWTAAFDWSVPGKSAPTILSDGNLRMQAALSSVAVIPRDENGVADLKRVSILVGSTAAGAAQCHAEYRFDTKRFSLYKEDGTGIVSSGLAGASINLENSRCTLILATSAESYGYYYSNTNGLTDKPVVFTLQLKNAAADIFAIYAKAEDLSDLSSDWKTLGNWTAVGNAAPTMALYSGVPQSVMAGSDTGISFTMSDSNGLANLKTAYFIVRDGNTTANACFVGVDFENMQLRLAADSGQAWVNQIVTIPTSGTTLSNSQCSISYLSLGSEFTSQPRSLSSSQFYIGLRFGATFRGNKRLEAYIEDKDGLNSRWQTLGTFSIR